jgi:UDP-hydrolysing UDP-N-acetyl-D-glucosamine 2-epimerase
VTRVLGLSSSRADAGILAPVWTALAAVDGVELHILLTGMHRRDGAPEPALPDGVIVHRGGLDLAGADASDAAHAMAAIASASADVMAATEPDLVMAIGDRLDMIPGVVASLPFNIPVLHIHGGELSYGAVDERVRHAMSKMAHLHCVALADAAERLARMGEEPWRIHVTGAPGLDALMAAPETGSELFAREVGLAELAGLRLVTVHPETNAADPLASLAAVLAALDAVPAPTLITAPNSDPGGAECRQRLLAFVEERPWAVFHDTLGTVLYANAMRHAAVMLGNSSSGIIEAGLFGLPVINVGGRQEGRVRGRNVYDLAPKPEAITAAIARLASADARCIDAPYGDGRASERIAALVARLPERAVLLHKQFSDACPRFTAPWQEPAPVRAARP